MVRAAQEVAVAAAPGRRRTSDHSGLELTTARLHLRPFTAADHAAIHAVYSDP
jgi:hypothetical protein